MKRNIVYASMLCVFCTAVHANEPVEALILYSTEKGQGAIWAEKQSAYFKEFDAVLINAGKKSVDLSKVCYKLYDASGNSYKLDTVDGKITAGSLDPGSLSRVFISLHLQVRMFIRLTLSRFSAIVSDGVVCR